MRAKAASPRRCEVPRLARGVTLVWPVNRARITVREGDGGDPVDERRDWAIPQICQTGQTLPPYGNNPGVLERLGSVRGEGCVTVLSGLSASHPQHGGSNPRRLHRESGRGG